MQILTVQCFTSWQIAELSAAGTTPLQSSLTVQATALDYGVLTNFPDLASGVNYGRTYGLRDRWLTVARPLQTTPQTGILQGSVLRREQTSGYNL